MKMKPTPRPPTPRRIPRRMVKTLHARAAASEKDFEDYDEGSEPNMRFSHALIVVLVLHVLAVGGVFAFNSLKGRHGASDHAKTAAAGKQASTPDVVTSPAKKSVSSARETSAPAPAAAEKTQAKSQPEMLAYTIVAGDTLKRIAIAHKTTVEAIEEANALDGKAVLHVGQQLKIPVKASAAKPATKPETASAKTSEPKAATTAPTAKTAEAKSAAAPKTSEAKAAAPTAKASDAKPAAPAAKSADSKPAAKSAEATAAPKPASDEASKADKKPEASDKTYTVAKGDNPYAIAKKLKVSYSELLKVNDIKDPTKLQIGQKLIIP